MNSSTLKQSETNQSSMKSKNLFVPKSNELLFGSDFDKSSSFSKEVRYRPKDLRSKKPNPRIRTKTRSK